ncbi:helix-turn-helix domain-containing protein [Porcipelethomonas sp.]|uniref:helix-turn-helix domain-containing protein n=1 Tax=Porcipelethomonas sp. TaxID=2981675 RepID=UPI003EFAA5EB
MLIYKKFFQLADSRNLDIEQLRKMFTPRTVYRLENSSEISAYTINKICSELECQPGDFMEYVSDEPDK